MSIIQHSTISLTRYSKEKIVFLTSIAVGTETCALGLQLLNSVTITSNEFFLKHISPFFCSALCRRSQQCWSDNARYQYAQHERLNHSRLDAAVNRFTKANVNYNLRSRTHNAFCSCLFIFFFSGTRLRRSIRKWADRKQNKYSRKLAKPQYQRQPTQLTYNRAQNVNIFSY